jgi:homeobox protein CDX
MIFQKYVKIPRLTFDLAPAPNRTRTRDKYRVVYSNYQRVELEKEYNFNKYITIRR